MLPARKMLFSCGRPWIKLAMAAAELSPSWFSPHTALPVIPATSFRLRILCDVLRAGQSLRSSLVRLFPRSCLGNGRIQARRKNHAKNG